MKKGSYLKMVVNNTVKAHLYLIHPGDELLMAYDFYPYKPPIPILISPESAILMLHLRIIAKKTDWKVKNDFAGKKEI